MLFIFNLLLDNELYMNERIKQPYVGVSGVVSPEIQASLETIATEAGLAEKGRILALGVKAVVAGARGQRCHLLIIKLEAATGNIGA